MKYREKLGYVAFGGSLMLIGMLSAGLFSPLGAQSESDDNFGKITCTELEIRKDGELAMSLEATKHGGTIALCRKGNSLGGVYIGNEEYGATVSVYGRNGPSDGMVRISVAEHGGIVSVYGEGKSQIAMGINEHGNPAIGSWDKNGFRLKRP